MNGIWVTYNILTFLKLKEHLLNTFTEASTIP